MIIKLGLARVLLLLTFFAFFLVFEFGLIQSWAQTNSTTAEPKSAEAKPGKTGVPSQIPPMPVEQEDAAQGDIYNIHFSDSQIISWSYGPLDSMFFWTANNSGAIVWEQHMKTGRRAKLLSATRISKLVPSKYDLFKAKIASSKNCTGLAIWIPQPAVDSDPFFSVIDLRGQLRDQVFFRQLNPDFVINKICWSNIDEKLFVAPIPYSNPSNMFGLGLLSMNTGSFVGLVNRNQLDMIEAIYAYPDKNQLLVLAKAVNGKFDKDIKAVIVDVATNAISEIGSVPANSDVRFSSNLDNIWLNRAGDNDVNSVVKQYVVALNLKGTLLNEIKLPGECFNPYPSPDGKYVVYSRNYRAWNSQEPIDNSKDLWIKRLIDNADFKINGTGTSGFWLPDSSAYYYHNESSSGFIRINRPEKEPALIR